MIFTAPPPLPIILMSVWGWRGGSVFSATTPVDAFSAACWHEAFRPRPLENCRAAYNNTDIVTSLTSTTIPAARTYV